MKVWCVALEGDIYKYMVRLFKKKKEAEEYVSKYKNIDYRIKQIEAEE